MHTSISGGRRAALRWCVLTAVVAVAVAGLAPSLAGPVAAGTPFEAALARLCTVALLAALGWLWVVASVVVVDAVRGCPHARRGVPDGVRRLLLGACGLALVGGGAVAPAYAGHPGHRSEPGLAGLPLPDRAGTVARIAWLVEHPEHHAHPRPEPSPRREARVCVVDDGDTLWALAAQALGPGAGDAEVAAAWRLLYRANRAAVGPDPDLIRPGLHLRLPDHLRGGTA